MKKSVLACLIAALAISGCQVKEEGEFAPEGKVFIATMEAMVDEASDVDTKTSMDTKGNVFWKRGDQVSVFAGSTVNEHYQVTDASDGRTAAALSTVESPGFLAGSEINNNVAFYPYAEAAEIKKSGNTYNLRDIVLPATQYYAEESFGNGAFPMAAVTSSTRDMILKFKNVLGGVKLQLTGTASITSIRVTGNNNEILCGDAEVTVSNTTVPSISLKSPDAKTVTLDCGAGVQLSTSTATAFIIALPPMTLSGGFTITATDSQGKQMEMKTTKSQTITRSNLLIMPAVSFESSEINVPVDRVTLSESSINLLEGETATLAATVLPENATNKNITWSSDNNSVATVSSAGVVTAVAPGTAVITATTVDGGKTATCTVTVLQPTISVTDVSLNESSLTLEVGGTATLTATVLPENATNKTVSWSSENESIATISSTGVVTAISPGTAIITATTEDGGKTASCTVTVPQPTISVTGVSLNALSLTLEVGGTATLTATVLPENATNKTVSWSSENESVATVSSTGVVTAVSPGTAIITATTEDGGFTATCNATVNDIAISLYDRYGDVANSYIVTTSGTYFFPTHIAGNGRSVDWASIGFTDGEEEAYPIGGGYTLIGNGVEVILNQNNCICDVNFSDNKIYFKATGAKGNAKVTLTNNGTRVWTWHIWCTDQPGTYSVNGYTVMDRNMGAITNGIEAEDSAEEMTGFYYPYGSPFGFTVNEYSYGIEGGQMYTMKQYFQHPERPFLKDKDGLYVPFNPYYASSPTDVWARIWGNGGAKTMYDPCPPGYKVTPYDFWNVISITAGSAWYDGYYGVKSGSCFFPYNGRVYAGTYTNYQGQTKRGIQCMDIYLSNAGQSYYVFTQGVRVFMWTSSSSGHSGLYYHVRKAQSDGGVIADGGLNTDILTRGMGVRCVAGW